MKKGAKRTQKSLELYQTLARQTVNRFWNIRLFYFSIKLASSQTMKSSISGL